MIQCKVSCLFLDWMSGTNLSKGCLFKAFNLMYLFDIKLSHCQTAINKNTFVTFWLHILGCFSFQSRTHKHNTTSHNDSWLIKEITFNSASAVHLQVLTVRPLYGLYQHSHLTNNYTNTHTHTLTHKHTRSLTSIDLSCWALLIHAGCIRKG